jgi:predicted enzyme related to lactoylglutathione lyase
MSNKIMWVELASTDVPASAKFYGELFGWPMVTDEQMNYTMTAFEGDETGVGFPAADEAQGYAAGSILVYVDVADVDATIARAKELGATIFQDKMEIPTVGWMAMFGDPGGNRIAAMQRMPQE